MDDKKIIALYFSRNEKAITETSKKYGRYLSSISYNILSDIADAEECVNDTYLTAWNTIPPKKPNILSVFLARITRFASLDLLRKRSADKRGGSEYTLSIDELSGIVSGNEDPADSAIEKEMTDAIDRFLRSLPVSACDIFVMRYFYADSIKDIAKHLCCSEGKVKTTLHRTRLGLAEFLKKEGYDI